MAIAHNMQIRPRARSSRLMVGVQLVIVTLWAVSVSLLAKRTWFSSESGMVEVSPEKVLNLFLSWTDGADLALLNEGVQVGQMSLITQEEGSFRTLLPADSLSASEEEEEVFKELSLSGSMQWPVSSIKTADVIPNDELYWRGTMWVNAGLNLHQGEIVLRTSKSGWGIQFGFDQSGGTISLDVNSGDNELISYQGNPSGLAKLPQLGWVGKLLPLESLAGSFVDAEGTLPSWAPQVRGQYGSAEIGGRRMLVYLLILDSGRAGEKGKEFVTLYLSEAGEPLLIQTAWGYEAMANILVPVEAGEKIETE